MKTRSRSSGSNGENASNYSIGLVLSGGGIFGAWEAGALRALWSVWATKHNKEEPPIRVVAGTSAGALTAPFALGRQEHIKSIVHWWTNVSKEDISTPNSGLLLPAFVFLLLCDGLADFGDPEAKGCQLPTEYEDFLKRVLGEQYRLANRKNPRLYGNYRTALQGLNTLENCKSSWPDKRLGIATIDFGRGRGDVVTNSPADTTSPGGIYESRLFRGIFASAITPLIGYPVSMTRNTNGPKTPHFDGGVYSEAPFKVLFDLAATVPAIVLTHVIVISAYPFFPGRRRTETPQFPKKPNFEQIGLRFDTLLSEASATKDILLARAALRLRALNEPEQKVKSMTGLTIPSPPPTLIEAAPGKRLGWDNGTVDQRKMKDLESLGEAEAEEIFLKQLP